MKINHTDITVVLDRSGSMQSIAPDTVGGFNRFLEDQQKAPGTADITCHQFDHEFETPIPTTEIHKAEPLVLGKTFVPRGNTAMNDAIGRAINEAGKRLSEKPENERAEKVVFVIITDGEENASKEFSSAKIKEMIEHQTKNYQWNFVFLAANQDAILAGASIGIRPSNAASYAATGQGTTSAFVNTSANILKGRSAGGQKMDLSYSTQQRQEQDSK